LFFARTINISTRAWDDPQGGGSTLSRRDAPRRERDRTRSRARNDTIRGDDTAIRGISGGRRMGGNCGPACEKYEYGDNKKAYAASHGSGTTCNQKGTSGWRRASASFHFVNALCKASLRFVSFSLSLSLPPLSRVLHAYFPKAATIGG